ncbi:MAG: fructosamine kinase family protein [Thalassolituus sp.]|jgi:fructosamine-3-kinase|uniref:fructosamine kinase family protein n=1 Tax=Thalassolituus sp. TaxID=2030822 RepID=UPI003515A7B4|nr:MAG: fructosamine kinase family protein [Thalassolituus sp.]
MALHKLSGQSAEYVLTRILADAIDQGWVPPDACSVTRFSQHLDSEAQQQYSVITEAGEYFIKRIPDQPGARDRFAAEMKSLLNIIGTRSVDTAIPFGTGVVDGYCYLLLNHLPLAVHGDWYLAGQRIAHLHNHTSEEGYGFQHTTYCGTTALNNQWHSSWADFFVRQRLEPLFKALEAKGEKFTRASVTAEKCYDMLSGHQPAPALLHGDLWSGNIGFVPDLESSRTVVFDPASYFGDAEADLAMTELFGRFPQAFYMGYQKYHDIPAGYQERREIYQLFHLLNHALMFGGHYVQQCRELMKRL